MQIVTSPRRFRRFGTELRDALQDSRAQPRRGRVHSGGDEGIDVLGGRRRSLSRFAETLQEKLMRLVFGSHVPFLPHGGKGVEKQLADIGLSESVRARDALVNELLEKIAEEEIDGNGRGKILDRTEKFLGADFVIFAALGDQEAIVVGAEAVITGCGEHAATAATGIDVLTLLDRFGVERNDVCIGHGGTFLKDEVMK